MASAEPITEKRCTRCGFTKPIDRFQPRPKSRIGYYSRCRDCIRIATKECQRRRRLNKDVVARERQQQSLARKTDGFRQKRRQYRARDDVKLKEQRYAASERGRQVGRAAVSRHRHKRWIQNGCRPTGRPASVQVARIVAAYQHGLTTYEVGAMVGLTASGVAYRLKRAGVERRGRLLGEQCVCADGHIVRSTLERAVDDWLSAHGIPHVVNPRCPWPPKLARCYSFADFQVADTYIEVWGLIGSKRYEQRMSEKLILYSNHNAKVISLFPKEVRADDFGKLTQFVGLGQHILE
jgi:hypothetical protein